MRLVTYDAGDGWIAGVELDGEVAALRDLGYPQRTVKELLADGPEAVAAVLSKALEHNVSTVSAGTVRLGPPIPDPDKIICLGLNYPTHVAETKRDVPSIPMLFPKFRTSLVGPHDDIVIPRITEKVDWEGELAVVIGRVAHRVSERDALQYVAGYTVTNDVTARDLQRATSQFTAGKAIDTFAPMGPGIVPASEIPDPQALTLTTRLNGEVMQHDTTGAMLFSVAATIAFISEIITLVPGDIIATGTPSGVGAARDPQVFMSAGDVIEVEIEGIGAIKNTVTGPLR